MYSSHCGSDSYEVAKTLLQIGKEYVQLDNMEKATGCFSEAVKILRSCDGDNDILISQALSSLGQNYARKKMYAKAIEMSTEALRIQKQHEDEFVSIADTLSTIGNILDEWGKVEQALQFYEEALRLYENAVGLDSVEVANCQYNVALIEKKLGESEAALLNFGQALRTHRTKEGDKSLGVSNDLYQIGEIYDSFGDKEKALQCFQECLKIRKENFSDDHLDVLAARRYVDTLRRRLRY